MASTYVASLVPPPDWGVGEEIPAAAFAGLSEDELLTELAQLEQLTAWLASRATSITERLLVSREESWESAGSDTTDAAAHLHRAERHAGVEDEIVLATGVTWRTAHARVGMVVGDPERARPIRSALARGEVSWSRAMQVFTATVVVAAEVVPDIIEAVTAPYPARSVHGVGGLLVPQPIFTSRLSRQVARYSTQEKRHRHALADRGTFAILDPDDGTGRFTVTGHAARIAGAHERVDATARRLRREGDPRTLAQLRSDVALDLLLYGDLPCTDDAAPSASHASFSAYSGALPPARVHVTVSLASLLGATDDPGTLDAVGRQEWLSAHVVRDIAHAAGSTWKRLVTDPATGYLVDLSTQSYAVTGRLRERVVARDRITRAPGRTTPAGRCDTDHDVDFGAGGRTSESNVSAKDRRGHNHKTRRTWRTAREPGINGAITWTTPTGRTYATTPWDYRDLPPARVSNPSSLECTTLHTARRPRPSPATPAAERHDRGPAGALRTHGRGRRPDGVRSGSGERADVPHTAAERLARRTGLDVETAFSEIAAMISAEPTWGPVGDPPPADIPGHLGRTDLDDLRITRPPEETRVDLGPGREDHEGQGDGDSGIRVKRPRRRAPTAAPPPWHLRRAGPPPF